MKIKTHVIIFVLLIMGACGGSEYKHTAPANNLMSAQGYAQGTTYQVQYIDTLHREFQRQIDALLQTFDSSLSTYKPYSVISQINQSQNDTLLITDSLFIVCFKTAKLVFKQTNGAFDPTVAPLANAYGFGYEKNDATISKHLIDSLMQYVGFNKITLLNDSFLIKPIGMKLDFNAIAQGLSVDYVAQFLEKKGIDNYLVEIGGELMAKGCSYLGKPWRIGIDQPMENNTNHQLNSVVNLTDKALATSGNYRKYHEINGEKVVHTINPETGKTLYSNLLSATVVAPTCALADAYATAFMVMGVAQAKSFVQSHNSIEALLIYSEKDNLKTWISPQLRRNVELLNE